jgi:hypothetical protein
MSILLPLAPEVYIPTAEDHAEYQAYSREIAARAERKRIMERVAERLTDLAAEWDERAARVADPGERAAVQTCAAELRRELSWLQYGTPVDVSEDDRLIA